MKLHKPAQTESTYSTNKEVDRLNGLSNIQRNELVKDISTTFYDIDYAIKWYIENVIKCTVAEKNTRLAVPVLFASGEKWAMIQKHGYLRDNQGKILTPLIVLRRNSVTRREDMQELKVLESADNRIIFEKKYTVQNRYNRFSLTNKPVEKEYYSVDVPKFLQIEYDLMVWVNNTAQLNDVVEQLLWFDGKAFGDTHKFTTYIDPPNFESTNQIGEDRIVRASMSVRTKGRILSSHGPNSSIMYKLNPANRIILTVEADADNRDVFGVATGLNASTLVSDVTGQIKGTISTVSREFVDYLNVNRQLTGAVITTSEARFPSQWIVAPDGLSTNVDNFTFFINGVLLEKSAIVSFTQSGAVSILTIDTSQLGYGLEASDEIIGIGKFINGDSLAQ